MGDLLGNVQDESDVTSNENHKNGLHRTNTTAVGALFQKSCFTCNGTSKYCCPKCDTLSCSLTCVKAHKESKNCDGVRDRTAFVPMEEFKDRHFLSDYQLLEDVNRTIDNVKRAKQKYGKLNFLPPNLFKLQSAARQRGTNLLILPFLFSKRKLNTTYFIYRDHKILWRLEWKFPMCDLTFNDERIDEVTLLGHCLDKYLLPNTDDSEKTAECGLEYYHSMGHKGVDVLLKDENCKDKKNDRYFLLRQNKSLMVNFKGKKIIEFPTLLVVPKIHLSSYEIIVN